MYMYCYITCIVTFNFLLLWIIHVIKILFVFLFVSLLSKSDLRKEIDRKGQDKILNDLFGVSFCPVLTNLSSLLNFL